jgi:hypothetical protein
MRTYGRTATTVAVLLVVAGAWVGVSLAASATADTTDTAAAAAAGRAALHEGSTLQGNGSIDEAWLTGTDPGDRITLMQTRVGGAGQRQPGHCRRLGSLIIRNLTPGPATTGWTPLDRSARPRPFTVLAPGQNPPTLSLYTGPAVAPGAELHHHA